MERNLRPKASSRKAKTIFTEFSQPPDFMFFSTDGKKASSVNGKAKPMPKPNIDTKPIQRLVVEVANSTNAALIMGPVHENDTSTVVKAMKNGAIRPPLSAWASEALTHFSGILISNSPKKESEKMKKITKKIRFGMPWVPIKLSESGPNTSESRAPITAKMNTIENPKAHAWRRLLRLFSLLCMKKLTVIGIIGKTHGVNIVTMPASSAPKKRPKIDLSFFSS